MLDLLSRITEAQPSQTTHRCQCGPWTGGRVGFVPSTRGAHMKAASAGPSAVRRMWHTSHSRTPPFPVRFGSGIVMGLGMVGTPCGPQLWAGRLVGCSGDTPSPTYSITHLSALCQALLSTASEGSQARAT